MIDPERKLAGILVPVFALRRPGDLGIGDTLAVRDAIEFCRRNKVGVLQVLPVNETGGDNSPYSALSAMALDPALLTVDPAHVPGLSQATYDRLVPESKIRERDQARVDYPLAKKLKFDLLRAGWVASRKELLEGASSDAIAFRQFIAEHHCWLHAYANFRALVALHDGNACWTSWKPEYQDPAGAEKLVDASETASDDRQFRKFIQWIAFRQWKELRSFADEQNVLLMGDMPFGVSRYSADVWAQRQLFDLEWSGGAPPEPFFKADEFVRKWGQNWGIPLYRWDVHAAENYQWWRRRIARLTDVFHLFRIDHVPGFFRIYAFPWIPERNHEFLDLSPEEVKERCGGRYPQFLPRPDEPEELAEQNATEGKRLLEMVLEAAGKNGVVAEDLGWVPGYLRPILKNLGIPGFSIPLWERNEDNSLKDRADLPQLSLATYATHDHLPLALFYEELVGKWLGPNGHEHWLEVKRLMKFLGESEDDPPKSFTDSLHRALLRALLETPCWLAVNMICDVLATRERFNAPGTSGDSNWSCRLELPLSGYEQDSRYSGKVAFLSKLVDETNRFPRADAPPD